MFKRAALLFLFLIPSLSFADSYCVYQAGSTVTGILYGDTFTQEMADRQCHVSYPSDTTGQNIRASGTHNCTAPIPDLTKYAFDCKNPSGTNFGIKVSSFSMKTCTLPEEWDNETGTCKVPDPPPVDCSGETNATHIHGSGGLSAIPEFVCKNSCRYATSRGFSLMDGTWSAVATGVGQQCVGSEDPANPYPADGTQDFNEDGPPNTFSDQPAPITTNNDPQPGDSTTRTETTKTETDPGPASHETGADGSSTMSKQGDKVKTETTTTETTVHPDGSQTITRSTNETTNTGPGFVSYIPPGGGPGTLTDTPSTTSSKSSGSVTTIGADGSIQTTSTGAADGDGNEAGDDDSSWQPGAPGEFTDITAELETAKTDLSNAIANVRTDAATLFGGLPTGAGALPCWSWTILNNTVPVCLSDYESQLTMIGNAIVLMSLFYSVVLVLRV